MTDNQPATVDRDASAVRRSIRIQAPLEKVWDAITRPEHIAQWFGQTAVLDTVAVGADGTIGWDDYGDFPVIIERLEPPQLIAYRWSNENARPVSPVDLAHSTVFTFTLEPLDGATQLTVVETGFENLADPEASLESNRRGWTEELDELVAYLEGSA